MERIEMYLKIIDPFLLKSISGHAQTFIQLIQNGRTEKEIEKFFRKEKYSNSYYRNIKSQLIRLLQSLSIISYSKGGNEVKKKYDFCYKNFTVGQKFLNKGERPEGIRLIKQVHQVAKKYDFVCLACETSSILYHDFIYYQGNYRKAKSYAKDMHHYLHAYTAEKKAQYHFHQIAGRMTITNKPGQYFDAINSIEQLNGTSIQYYSHLFRLKILLGVQQGDYPAVSQQCKKALQFFAGRKGVHSSTFQFLHLKKGISHMVQSDYRKAGRSFSQAAKLAPVKSVNDYISRLYLALNAIHAKNYTEAYEIYRANRKCKFAPIREQFTIIEAYMCFLAHEGYLQLDRRFRIGKYLNETFQAQANKQGDNINILIAELLVYYARDREKFIDRVDAVKRYSYQYLKTTETQRAKHFMKILCLLPKANFHIPTLRRLAKRHIDWLDDHPLHVGNNFAIEIIPFDDLLKMILGKAERKMAT